MSNAIYDENTYKENVLHITTGFNFQAARSLFPSQFDACPLHWHPEYEINFIQAGDFHFAVDGKSYHVKEGQVLIINPKSLHEMLFPQKEKGLIFTVIFGEQFVFPSITDPVYEKYIFPLHVYRKVFPVFLSGEETWEKELFKKFYELDTEYVQTDPVFYLKARTILLSLFYQFIYRNKMVTVNTKYQNRISKIRKILGGIQNNYSEDIEINKLAKEANYTAEHFSRSFKSIIGKSPKQYLLEYRLAQAEKMLQQENDSISNIAARCGFNDINYFSRIFKKKNNITPREYQGLFKGLVV
jgi:AraC-like DNA-binding protein/mannose-6-phosphate isomerase-like protein (cupin superfamily)